MFIHVTEDMFKTGQPLAQGEVLIWMKKYAPEDVIAGVARLKLADMPLENGQMILGHSETGHHHVLEAERQGVAISAAAVALIDAANDTFVELRLREPCILKHLRSTDTHKAYLLPPGEYIRGIREEQSPEGWLRVAD